MLVGLCPCWINFVSMDNRPECMISLLSKANRFRLGLSVVRNVAFAVSSKQPIALNQDTYRGQENSLHTLDPPHLG